ncbi:MAG: RNA polymerase factor sigma-32 [Proteobacteria bacterium]|nr:RNA polymerase factor sigma-32 [Pseudomonadota bacterium]
MANIETVETQRANRRFIKESMRAPMLSREHEQELARHWREEKDQVALHELIRCHIRLAISAATRFRYYGLPMGDLIQEGNIGLMQAAARFDPDRGVRFSTYATWWVRAAMQNYILRNWSIVRTGTTRAQKSLFFSFRRLRAKIENRGFGEMDEEGRRQIANLLGTSVRDVEIMDSYLSSRDQSLHAAIGERGEDEMQDFVKDSRPSPEQVVLKVLDGETRSRWLAEAIKELAPRERTIISKRHLHDQGATLAELGRELGLSKERVRQIEYKAIGKLRVSMAKHVTDPSDIFCQD